MFIINIDIDECQDEPCGSQSTCINTIGSYECKCNDTHKKNDAGQCVGKLVKALKFTN